MKRWLVGLLALVVGGLPSAAATAGIDRNDDSFGINFDQGGNNIYGYPAPFSTFTVYLLLANPLGPVDGFECTVTRSGVPSYPAGVDLGPGAVDSDPSTDGFAVSGASAYPVINGMVQLCTLRFVAVSSGPVEFRLGPATTPTLAGGLPIVMDGGVPRQCGVSTCDFSLPVATANPQSIPLYPPCSEGPYYNIFIDVTASAAGLPDQTIRAGTRNATTDGYDAGYDLPLPAPPPGTYVQTSFEHADWALGPRFRTDYRYRWDDVYGFRVWPLLIETNVSGSVSLTFEPNYEWGPSDLLLHDRQSDAIVDLFWSPTHTLTCDGLPNSYRYDLVMSAPALPPELAPTSRPLPTGWSMIGLPLAPQPGSTVLSLLDYPAPGTQVVNDYAAATGYRQLGATTPVHQGTGYWLATSDAYDWTMAGTRDLDGVTVPLTAGWNLVGNANWFPGPVTGLRVQQGATEHPWTTAVSMGLVSPDLQTLDEVGGAYVAATALQPWYGYWVNALQDGLSLTFRWENFIAGAKSEAAAPAVTHATASSWQSTLILVDAAGRQREVQVGRQAGATAGFDAMFDRPLPPPPPAGGPQLMSHRPEWGLAAGAAFSRDVVGPADVVASWTLVAVSSNSGPAQLQWSTGAWPAGVDAELYLPGEDGVVVPSMRSQASYPVMLGGAAVQLVMREKVYVTGIDELPAMAYGLTAQPNPFNPQTALTFELPVAGRAEVRIYSVRGELVTVLGGEARDSGRQRLDWDGVDRFGRAVPSGTYVARLFVDGIETGAGVGVSLVR